MNENIKGTKGEQIIMINFVESRWYFDTLRISCKNVTVAFMLHCHKNITVAELSHCGKIITVAELSHCGKIITVAEMSHCCIYTPPMENDPPPVEIESRPPPVENDPTDGNKESDPHRWKMRKGYVYPLDLYT